jgi:DNA-binding CsgD family transcriptional regulator
MQNSCSCLLDPTFNVVFATTPPEPLKADDFAPNKPLWAGFGTGAERLQAALTRVVADNQAVTIVVADNRAGEARVTLTPVEMRGLRVHVTLATMPSQVRSLSDRQRQICALLGAGMSSREIGAALDLVRETVDNHRAAIAKKIGIKPHSLAAWCGENREWF